uniref:Pollen Ole e 1 allergen and extensin family protein n=1 Tax=Zea mays TaxID=4577 RepID=B6TXH9_MAIZE|nr:hypothetical protein [Zea mays]
MQITRRTFPMLAPPRLPLVGALLLLLAVALGAVPCESAALRLRGSVACLDCDEEHDLSGVVVAVKCAGDDDGGAGLHAAQTDGRGNFDVAVPAAASASGARRPGPGAWLRLLPRLLCSGLPPRLLHEVRCG